MTLAHLLLRRVGEAWQTPLGPQGLGLTLALLGLYAAVAIPWGLRSGLLRHRWRRPAPLPLLRHALALLLMPALVEELLFRVLLLPHPGEAIPPGAAVLWGTLGVAVFVAYHPLAGRLWYPIGRRLFHDRRFLGLCALLGVVCSLAYAATGSLLAPLLIHWLVVLVWLEALGGLAWLGRAQE